MKMLNRIISLLMVALMLTTAVPFTPVSAADDGVESYTLTVEKTYGDSSLAENSSVGGMSFFGSTEFDGCYGNQLSGVAREIYDSLVKSYATDKITGEYTYAFETPFTFDAEISGGSIVMNDELEEIGIEIGYAVQAALDAFLYDHPKVFWLKIIKTSYGISASGNSVGGYTGIIDDITVIPTEIYSGASAKISQFDTAVESALASVTVTESRYETLKNIHDYICNNAWYNLVDEQRVHSSEPFFIGDGGVVCEGYAKTFKVLCDRLELPCVLVSGDAGGAHMWNYVQMDDGKWYLVDATWDDQESKIYDTYFLADANTVGFNDVTISEERTERNDFSGTGIFTFTYPVLSATAYTVHIHEWESDYTVDIEPTCTEKGSKSIHCKTEGCFVQKNITEIPISETHHYENYICALCGVYDETNLLSYGQCGESVYYTLDTEGNMRVFGEGEMYDYQCYYDEFYKVEYTTAPWDAKPLQSSNRNLIKNVEIENINSIGDYAFYKCGNLTSIKISDSVRKINSWSFGYCQKLESVIIPNNTVKIYAYAFAHCIKMRNITVPSSVTYIGSYAFYGCSELESIVVNKENNYYSNDALGALYDKSKSVLYVIPQKIKSEVYIIPDGVEKIETYAFSYGTDINSIVIPSSVQHISDRAFDWDGECFDLVHYLGTSDDWNRIEKGKYNYYLTNSPCHYCSKKEKSNATCVNDGNETGWYCNDCEEYVIGGELITKLGHSFSDEYTVDKEPTCTTKGSKSQHCDREGCTTQINITSIPATNHKNKTEYIQQDATCSEVGYTEGVYCSDCGEWIEGHDEIVALTHDMNKWAKNDNGTHSRSCRRDNCDYTETSDCSYSDWNTTKSATCTETGSKTKNCTVCGYAVTEEIAKLPHTPDTAVIENKVEPKCEIKGSYDEVVYCSVCETELSRTEKEISALSHNWNEGVINPVSTCKTHGTKTYTCQDDTSHKKTEQVALDSSNHEGGTYLKDAAEATCTSAGYTGDIYCSGCNVKLKTGEAIPVKSHTFTTYISDGNATCLADGTKTAVCDVCNKAKDTVTDEGSKDNAEHKYSVRAGSSATCTQDGEKIYVCDVCEIATYTETVLATGKHSFVACLGEDPTCTEDGFVEYCCEICETETYRETVPATGHDYDSVVTAPTCTSKGYTTHICSVCGESYKDVYANAKGHKGGTATCKTKAECTVCGEEYGSVNANNHKSLVVLKAVPSTCTKTGLTEGKKCADCGKVTLAQKTVAKKAHTNKTTVTKATLSKNGKSETKCTACGYVSKTAVIYAPKTVKLSVTAYTYNGKTKTPSVTVKDSKGKKLKSGTDYTVKYSKGRKSPGKYTVTVTFKGNYSGTKKLTFEIAPAKVTLSKLTAGSKALTATWKTVSGATGYEVQYSTSKKFTKKTTKTVTIKKAKTKKTTIKKLKKGKKYYVKVRAYKTVDGKKIYGAWSTVKNVKVK